MNKPRIIDVKPAHLAIGVEPTTTIKAQFAKSGYYPLAADSITADSVYMSSLNTPVPADIALVDNGYRIEVQPHEALQPGTNYKITVIGDIDHDGISEGVYDIYNNPMEGVYTWWFTTSGEAVARPTLISPAHNTITHEPVLAWSEVVGADYYEVQMDVSSTLTNPQLFTTTSTTLIPNVDMGYIYYWRVRAISATEEATPTLTYSPWSNTWHFRYDELGDPIEDEPDPFMMVSSYPADGTTNLGVLDKVRITMNKPVDITSLLDAPIYITKRSNM